jgi:hypothetical protein
VAAFVLGDGELLVLASARDVLSRVEAIDVADGEVDAAWLHDGTVLRVLAPEGPDGPVVVEVTDDVDSSPARSTPGNGRPAGRAG